MIQYTAPLSGYSSLLTGQNTIVKLYNRFTQVQIQGCSTTVFDEKWRTVAELLTGGATFPPSSSNAKHSTATSISRHTEEPFSPLFKVNGLMNDMSGKGLQMHTAHCGRWQKGKELQSQQSLLLISCAAYSYERRADGMMGSPAAPSNSLKRTKESHDGVQRVGGTSWTIYNPCLVRLCGKPSPKSTANTLDVSLSILLQREWRKEKGEISAFVAPPFTDSGCWRAPPAAPLPASASPPGPSAVWAARPWFGRSAGSPAAARQTADGTGRWRPCSLSGPGYPSDLWRPPSVCTADGGGCPEIAECRDRALR